VPLLDQAWSVGMTHISLIAAWRGRVTMYYALLAHPTVAVPVPERAVNPAAPMEAVLYDLLCRQAPGPHSPPGAA
jgi:hypothetical protein